MALRHASGLLLLAVLAVGMPRPTAASEDKSAPEADPARGAPLPAEPASSPVAAAVSGLAPRGLHHGHVFADRRLERLLREARDIVLIYETRPGRTDGVLIDVRVYRDDVRTTSVATTAETDAIEVSGAARLLSPTSMERRAAARDIVESGDPGAAAILAEALAREEDAAVRESFVRALGRTPGDDAIVALAEAALGDDDEGVREAAAEALGKTWSDAALDPLLRALSDGSSAVRVAAAEALGRTWNDDSMDALVEVAVHDPSAQVREAAVWALSRLGAEAVVATLTALSDDPSRRVRGAAMEVLAALASPLDRDD